MAFLKSLSTRTTLLAMPLMLVFAISASILAVVDLGARRDRAADPAHTALRFSPPPASE